MCTVCLTDGDSLCVTIRAPEDREDREEQLGNQEQRFVSTNKSTVSNKEELSVMMINFDLVLWLRAEVKTIYSCCSCLLTVLFLCCFLSGNFWK